MRRVALIVALLAGVTLSTGGASSIEEDAPFVTMPYALGALPTTIAFGPDGAFYVATFAGNVHRYLNIDGAIAGPPEVVISGLESPIGMNFGPDGSLYVVSSDPGNATDGRTWGVVSRFDVSGLPQVADAGERVLEDIPTGVHDAGAIAFGPDGRAYVGVPSSTLDGYNGPAEPTPEVRLVTLSILRFDPAAVGERPFSALRHRASGVADPDPIDTVATGIHNAHDLAFRGEDVFTASNGPQGQEPYGEDYVVRVQDARSSAFAEETGWDFGTPRCLWATGEDGWPTASPSTYPIDPATRTCAGVDPVAVTLGLHRGATGLAVAPDGLDPWAGDLFIAEWGNLNPARGVHGHVLRRIGLTADGSVAARGDGRPDIEDLLQLPAPIDVAFYGDSMYVADFAAGVVLRLTPAA